MTGSWLTNDYYSSIVSGAAARAIDSGRLLLLAPRLSSLADLEDLNVDGVIVVDPLEHDPTVTSLREIGLAYVTIDRDLSRPDSWWVGADNRGNTIALLDHLASRGARDIAILSSNEQWAWIKDSVSAYLGWCEDHGLEPRVTNIDLNSPRVSAEQAVGLLLQEVSPPDAILALPYGAALGSIRAAHKELLHVPDDLLVASGVDSHALQVSSPPVTAGDLRPEYVAQAAVELLVQRISSDGEFGPIVADAKMVVRSSTTPAQLGP